MRIAQICIRALLLAMVLSVGQSAFAQQISPNNPFRSFNIHGINYGSMRWEQEHAQQRRQHPTVQQPMRVRRSRR